MLFQGQEFLSYSSFDFPVPPNLNWDAAEQNKGIVNEVSALLRLPIVPGASAAFALAPLRVIAVCNSLVCLLNFGPALLATPVHVPCANRPGKWQQVFNGDSTQYFPSFQGIGSQEIDFDANGTAVVDIGPFSMLCFH